MRAISRATCGALLCLGALTLVWTLGGREEGVGTAVGPSALSEHNSAVGQDPTGETGEAGASSHASRELVGQDKAGSSVRLTGVVLDSAAPIAGAALSLTVLTKEDSKWEVAWHEDDWGALERTVLRANSDASGRFAFDLSGDVPHGAVLWATHPGHLAGFALLRPERSSWPRELRLVLETAPVLTAFVQDASGRPAPGARVEQFGLTPDGSARGEGGMNEFRARRLLARDAVTGADGIARLEALPGEQMLVASRSAERSAPWRGPARERVTLTLVPTFEVRGRVALPDSSHLNSNGERRITIAAQQKNLWRSLHTIRSVESGAWGPVSLPVLAVEQYRIRLEGSPIIPEEVFFLPPEPGARLNHDLLAELGMRVCVRVTDEEVRILPEGVAKVQWQDPDDPEHWNFIERGPCPPGDPDEGLIAAWSVPRGMVIVEASAPGHVTVRSGLVNAETYENACYPITLKRASRVAGRCLHLGKPVSDFEVLTWRTSDRSYTSTRFYDREDGSFELDTAPEGDCWITASSGSLPGCEPRQIRTAAGSTTEVVLELPEALRGVGQVVDEETGEGIPEAFVQLFVPGDLIAIARWGYPIPAGPDGVFEVDGFRPGKNELRVLAKGYSRQFLTRSAVAGEVLDWGVLSLARSHTLTFVLEDTSGVKDFDGIQVTGRGGQVLLPREVDSDGTVEFTDVGAGDYELIIEEPDDTTTSIMTRLLPGRDWTFRHRIAGANRLTVEVLVSDPAELAGGLAIAVTWASPLGYNVMRTVGPILETARIFEVHGIDSGTVQAEIFDSQQVTRAAASGSFSGGALHLTLALTSKAIVFEVVDGEDLPVADVLVTASDPRQPGLRWGSTDSSGRCELRGLSEGELLVSLRHGTRGSHLGIPIDASAGRVKLVLDARAAIELVFQDGEERLTGVFCSLIDVGSPSQLGGHTDEEGRLAIRELGEGGYRLDASKSDCWPVQFSARARPEPELQRVEMRRLGDLALQIVAAGGLPVSALAVELDSLEFEASVASWIGKKLVRSDGLVTDLQGRIRVEGLPRGRYGWRIELPDGEALEGELVVEPGPVSEVRLSLPE